MNLPQKIAYNTAVQTLGKFVTATSTLVITMLITRRFGPSGFGDFMIMLSFPALFWMMVDFGFNAIATREITKDREKAPSYFENLLMIRIFLATFLIIVALFILHFLPYSDLVKLGVTLNLFSLYAMTTFSTSNVIFQTNLRYDFSVLSTALGSLLNLSLVFIFIKLGLGLLPLVVASLVGNLSMMVSSLILVRRFITLGKFKMDPFLCRYLIKTTLPVGLALIFNVIDFKIDTFMLSVLPLPARPGLTNSETVGIYSAAYKILEVVLVVPTFFMNAVYPILVRHYSENLKKAKNTLQRAFDVLVSLSFPISVGGFLLAFPIIRLVAGSKFDQSVLPLQILMLEVFAFYISSLFMWGVLVLEKQIFLPWFYGGAAILNIILNLIFIPRHSFYAAAIITGVTEVLILILLLLTVARTLDFYPSLKIVPKVILASFVMSLVVIGARSFFVLIPVFLGGGIYFLILLLLVKEVRFGVKNLWRK